MLLHCSYPFSMMCAEYRVLYLSFSNFSCQESDVKWAVNIAVVLKYVSNYCSSSAVISCICVTAADMHHIHPFDRMCLTLRAIIRWPHPSSSYPQFSVDKLWRGKTVILQSDVTISMACCEFYPCICFCSMAFQLMVNCCHAQTCTFIFLLVRLVKMGHLQVSP